MAGEVSNARLGVPLWQQERILRVRHADSVGHLAGMKAGVNQSGLACASPPTSPGTDPLKLFSFPARDKHSHYWPISIVAELTQQR